MQVLIGELGELGRRAVACKHWRWMPGMAILTSGEPYRLTQTDTAFFTIGPDADVIIIGFDQGHHLTPDLSDPATLGCLLHLVREACGNMQACSYSENHVSWGVFVYAGIYLNRLSEDCESEAEALVAALEAV